VVIRFLHLKTKEDDYNEDEDQLEEESAIGETGHIRDILSFL
jgi:hypothetical protein